MTTFAQPESTFISRTRLQLAAALVAGIAIGSIAAAGLIDGQPAAADPVVQAAPAAPRGRRNGPRDDLSLGAVPGLVHAPAGASTDDDRGRAVPRLVHGGRVGSAPLR